MALALAIAKFGIGLEDILGLPMYRIIPNQLGNATDDNLYRLCNRDFTYLCVAFLMLFGISEKTDPVVQQLLANFLEDRSY
jgi:hypothetical protein